MLVEYCPFSGTWPFLWNLQFRGGGRQYLRIIFSLGTVAHTCNPSTLGVQARRITKSGVQDQTVQHDETPSLLKNTKKLARHHGTRLWSQLLGRLGQKNRLNLEGKGCSKLRLNHCTPAWATRVKFCLKIIKKKKRIIDSVTNRLLKLTNWFSNSA